MSSVRLRAEGIGHRFGALEVLADIDLDIRPGEVTVLLGPSGCGKSTLLAILGGLLQPVPRLALALVGAAARAAGEACAAEAEAAVLVPARRLELLPTYKANRPPMPDELRSQLPLITDWSTAAGWPLLREEGREADDLIAAVALNCPGQPVAVVTFDKDLAQLVSPGVIEMLQPAAKGLLESFGPAEIEAKFGVPPSAIGDFLALVGDTSDNINGVPSVGPKTAAALLRQFGTLDALLANIDAVEKPALRETLRGQTALLRRNRELVALDTRLPIGWTGVEGIRRRPPDFDRLFAIARDHGFHSLEAAIAKARERFRHQDLFSFMA